MVLLNACAILKTQFLKLHSQTALDKLANRKRRGCCVVVKDHNGLVYAALTKPMKGCPDPTTAESWRALCAVEFCRDLV
jgi:hypothetical protein